MNQKQILIIIIGEREKEIYCVSSVWMNHITVTTHLEFKIKWEFNQKSYVKISVPIKRSISKHQSK